MNQVKNIKLKKWNYFLVLLLAYFVCFLKLGSFHIRWWDESLFAVNTYEMLANGKWFSLYFDQAPDLFNSKPPLTCWFQALAVTVFGYTELAIRFPSAVAAFATVILLFHVFSKTFSLLHGWVVALIVLTSQGFIHFHTARTGDSDALLSFFMVANLMLFVRYMMFPRRRDLLLFFITLAAALATKLFAGLLFLPGYFFILIYFKKLKAFFLNPYTLIGTLSVIAGVVFLCFMRESDAPGYFQVILQKDAGRLTHVVEQHRESLWFYFDNLLNYRFSYWFMFSVMGIGLFFVIQEQHGRIFFLTVLACLVSYVLVITSSVTKLEWYDMPILPLLACFATLPIVSMIQTITSRKIQFIAVGLLFLYPYKVLFGKAQGNVIPGGEMKLEANEMYLFNAKKLHENLDGTTVFYTGWKGSLLFYHYAFAEKKQDIKLVSELKHIKPNSKVLVASDSLKALLHEQFELTPINAFHDAELVAVGGFKN